MLKTILNHQLFAVFFLVACKFFPFLYSFLPTEVILSAVVFPIKSRVASAVF